VYRKRTLKIEDLVNKVNDYLALDIISQSKKQSLACFLESILHDTNNYNGFSYNFNWNEDPDRVNKQYNRAYYLPKAVCVKRKKKYEIGE
jgi:hypothetical protein